MLFVEAQRNSGMGALWVGALAIALYLFAAGAMMKQYVWRAVPVSDPAAPAAFVNAPGPH